ncbi:MAG: STAS-like domain-containing protein [Fusobacteriaceae bacterium]
MILDFENVDFIGQGFADEIFRVYTIAHPEINLKYMNASPIIEKMILHVKKN